MNRKLNAFTMLELVVVMGILVAMALLVLPIAISSVQEARAENAARDIVSRMYDAQQSAHARRNNKSYGIRFITTGFSIFIGESYATAEDVLDVTFTAALTISDITLTGGGDEVVFTAGSFRPSTNGTVELSDGNSTYLITINSEGFIDYNKV